MGEEPAERARVEAAAAEREEDGIDRAAGELRPAVLEVAPQPVGSLLAQRDDALLVALAAHPHRLLLEVDVRQIEADCLSAAQASRVDELEQSAVPEPQRVVAFERAQDSIYLLGFGRVRQPPAAPR